MKRVWKPFRWWSLAGLGYAVVFSIWVWQLSTSKQDFRSIQVAYQLMGLVVMLTLMYLIGRGFDWLFNIRVFDAGNVLVIKRRTVSCRVALDQITRVERLLGKEQRVKLSLAQPCALGSTITFKISNQPSNEQFCALADDLHQRSRCCENQRAHK
ncbi:MAG: hypothetical protein JNJ83_23530 [Verrucomicrobiaceae bacterium]|nr:hypothetical protein [Verrucomicrobiaceae bacterium]